MMIRQNEKERLRNMGVDLHDHLIWKPFERACRTIWNI